MVIFVCLGEIKKIIGNDYEVTVMVPAGKYWKWPSKEDRIKSSWYYYRNIEGGTLNVPQSKYWGYMSPLSHMDRRPWPQAVECQRFCGSKVTSEIKQMPRGHVPQCSIAGDANKHGRTHTVFSETLAAFMTFMTMYYMLSYSWSVHNIWSADMYVSQSDMSALGPDRNINIIQNICHTEKYLSHRKNPWHTAL